MNKVEVRFQKNQFIVNTNIPINTKSNFSGFVFIFISLGILRNPKRIRVEVRFQKFKFIVNTNIPINMKSKF